MMNYQQNPLNELKRFFKASTILNKLMIINIVVFILINIINLIFWLFQISNNPQGLPGISLITYYLSVPASLESLLMRPWTIITYMFLQEDFMHILFNMMVLYFGGRIFTEYMTEKKLLSTYLIGGLTGALFFIAAYNVFPVFQSTMSYTVALGSSASVLAVLIAIATYVPEYSVVLFLFGRVKLKYVALAVILIDLLSIAGGNSGGHIAHLGGAFWGFTYIRMMKKGKDFTLNTDAMNFKKYFKFFTKQKKETSFGFNADNGRPLSDDEYNSRKVVDQEKTDRILEKISRSGYGSLTKSEKEYLFQSSKKQ